LFDVFHGEAEFAGALYEAENVNVVLRILAVTTVSARGLRNDPE
jgi:hypothetical protein